VGQRVHAVCVARPGSDVAADRILARASIDLPPHMVPRAIEFVDALPRSPNGKVDYKTLAADRRDGVAS
jgi:acyl-CoA synthetase (AMP-forming)/AMP-acid ligase II